MIVFGDAIFEFVDIFTDFRVAADEGYERLCVRPSVSERVVDFDGGKNVFPGEREEGAGGEGACPYGGELFIVLGEEIYYEATELERE